MYNRLLRHVNDTNILVEKQFGSRNNPTTEKANYSLINKIASALNEKLTEGGIFCYLAKISDFVKNETLLSKFNFYGIIGKAS